MTSSQQAGPGATLLNDAQWSQIQQAIASLNPSQLTWVSGYLAGLAQSQQGVNALAQPQAEVATSKSLTILYGSQTGNAKSLAEEYKAQVEEKGLKANLVNMADYKPRQIKNETHVVIVVSTHGEGEAPDDAVELHEFIGGKKAPKLEGLKYAVLGLGDSSYEFFCQTAKDFDQRLSALGATALHPRVDCDVDYEQAAADWAEAVTVKVQDELKQQSQVVPMPGVKLNTGNESAYSKKHPFTARLTESQKITGRDSVKDVRHVEISLEGSGITYQPGDALGVWFENDPALVDEFLKLLSLSADESVEFDGEKLTLRDALISKYELTQSYPTFVSSYAQAINSQELMTLSEDNKALREWLADRQLIDIVREYPGVLSAEQLQGCLRKLMPRLYSIASSQAEVEDEVHLTVALVEYDAFGQPHQGGASGYLCKRLEEDGEVKVFVEHNLNFKLPDNPETPVIMIGPGTGIAPFRAFMQQREAEGAEGKNWLFFGNPHFTQDFLYQTEWQAYVKSGLLTHISLAFSRDQAEKIYVQHKLLEQGQEVFQWLEQGAHLYVCGDANHMAKDVHQALVEIVQQYANKSAEEAEQYLNELRRAKRYQKDVY